MGRPLWFTFGVASLATGAAGVVLPLVPATPLLLLAAFCFARSSPRLHAWLLDHPHFGPVIVDWREHGSISRNVKLAALVVMAATLAGSTAFGVPFWIVAIQAVVFAAVATFILTRPDRVPGDD
ncbi:MAG: YbaN family protein [Xanthobacteraceae bacterium]|nr:YbaN family protein [Xanthobacteraceae bacterium]PWB61180.1 MAG: DUF454 domain-containing protein [Bradyrhizobiaceae bacterium]